MAVPWGLVLFLVGILYGFLAHGKQDKSDLFKRGFLIGLVLALILAVLGYFAGAPALGVAGALGIIISAIVLSLVFIIGVWLGDVLEPKSRRR